MTLMPCLHHLPMHRFGIGWVCSQCGVPCTPTRRDVSGQFFDREIGAVSASPATPVDDPLGLKIAEPTSTIAVTSELLATRARVDATIEHLVAGGALDPQFILGLLNEVKAALQQSELVEPQK